MNQLGGAAGTTPQVAWSELFEEEQLVLTARGYGRDTYPDVSPQAEGRDYLTGICLSGGGIRSASVSLGVLQAFADQKLVRHLDYMSSVSGGGYTAAALALRYAQAAGKPTPATDPDAAFPFAEDSDALALLRHSANYLAPRGLSSLVTGFFVVARSLLLNVFIWLFLGGFAFAVLMAVYYERSRDCVLLPWIPTGTPCRDSSLFDWLLLAAAALAAILVALVIGFSLSSWRLATRPAGADGAPGKPGDELSPWLRLAIAAFACLAGVWLARTSWSTDGRDLIVLTPFGLIVLWTLTPLVGPKWPPLVETWLLVLALVGVLAAAWVADDAPGFFGDSRTMVALTVAALAGYLLYRSRQTTGARPALSPKYARRRLQERLSGRFLLLIALCVTLGAVPLIPDLIGYLLAKKQPGAEDLQTVIGAHQPPGLLTLVFYLFSAAAALYGYYRTRLQGVLGATTGFVIIAGSVLLFYATVILAHWIALQLLPAAGIQVDRAVIPSVLTMWQAACIGGVVTAFALAFFVNINDVSLGRYYRDRLMEAFMPDESTGIENLESPATTADRFRLTQIAGRLSPEPPPPAPAPGGPLRRWFSHAIEPARGAPPPSPAPLLGPYPLINTYVVRRRSPSATTRRRGGDSFLLSPLFCGSSETGWRPTPDVVEGELTLATAMAISGAAANPGGGLAGHGVTANFVVALAMSFLSLRLGYRFRWDHDSWVRRWWNPFGNHFVPAASELAGELFGVTSRRAAFVELSDGGHFENLGLYELVRRRCGVIVVCDGGQDPSTAYEAFTSAITLIREDFGIDFAFDMRVRSGKVFEPSGPQQIVSRPTPDEYPRAAEFARRGYFLATIRYPKPGSKSRVEMAGDGPAKGLLIYLKSAMIPGLSLTSRGYKGANPEFPYESTADQFFSPEQFEAYRDVGEQIARQMIRDTDLRRLFADGRPPLALLRRGYGFAAATR